MRKTKRVALSHPSPLFSDVPVTLVAPIASIGPVQLVEDDAEDALAEDAAVGAKEVR